MFRGVGTAIITPFDKNFNVDYSSLKKICRQQIISGVDALIVLGTTGESPVISLEEREKIIATVVEESKGKTKIIVGTGTNDTNHVIQLNKSAEELGADGLLIVNPYYNKGTQESLISHYKFVADKTSLPILLYNVPTRTGMNLLPETIIKISESCPNVIGIKEACGNISQIAHLMSIKSKEFLVYSGNDDQTLPIMALGGVGIISVFSNAYPKELKQITNAIFNNDYSLAQKLNNKYLSMMNAFFIETSPMPIKYVMSKLNFCENILRLPLEPISKKTENLLDKEMKNIVS